MADEQDIQQPEQDGTPKLGVKEFAAKIKAKYPDYAGIDDNTLVQKIVAKYPQYKDQIDFGQKKNSLPTSQPSSPDATPSQNQSGSVAQSTSQGNSQQPQTVQPQTKPQQPQPFDPATFMRQSRANVLQQPVQDNTTNVAPKEAIQAQYNQTNIPQWNKEKADYKEKVIKATPDAITNAAVKSLKIKGIDPNNAALLNKEKQNFQQQVEDGNATVGFDKNGTPGLIQNPGFFSSFYSHMMSAINENKEAREFHDMTDEQKVKFANQQLTEKPSAYIGEKPTNIGSVGAMAGGALPTLGLYAAGAAAGGILESLAPETGGLSNLALKPVMSFLVNAGAEADKSEMNGIMQRYAQIKSHYPDLSDEQAMSEAKKGADVDRLAGIGQAALFSETGGVLGKSVTRNFIKEAVKSGADIGAKSAIVEGAKDVGHNAEGVTNKSLSDIAKDMGNAFSENAPMGTLLHAFMGVATGIAKAPAFIKSALKYDISTKIPPEQVTAELEKNVQSGAISADDANKAEADLNQFRATLQTVPSYLSDEAKASVTGLIIKRDNLLAQSKGLDKTAQDLSKQQTDAINNQIQNIYRTGKPLEFETNPATGQTYAKPTYDDVAQQNVKDLADKIAKGKQVTDPQDLQTQSNFPKELETELQNRLKEDQQAGKENSGVQQNINSFLKDKQPTIQSAVITINGKTYEGKNHAEAILKAKQDGQDISQVDRQGQGQFKLSDGTIISRDEAKQRFGQDKAELLIPQDEAAKQADKQYKEIATPSKEEPAPVRAADKPAEPVSSPVISDKENPALKDVQSTTKALEEAAKSGKEMKIPFKGKFADGKDFDVELSKPQEYTNFGGDKVKGFKGLANSNVRYESVAEAYHKAKSDGSNPELVKAVEEALTQKEPTPTKEQQPISKPINTEENNSTNKQEAVPSTTDLEGFGGRGGRNRLYDRVKNLDEPTDIDGKILHYFAGGGKVHPESFSKEVVGMKRKGYGDKEGSYPSEVKGNTLVKATDENGKPNPTIIQLAESWGDGTNDHKIRNKIIDVLQSHGSRESAATELINRYDQEYIEAKHQKEENDYWEGLHKQEVAAEENYLTEKGKEQDEIEQDPEYIKHLINQYETETVPVNDKQPDTGSKTEGGEARSTPKDTQPEGADKSERPSDVRGSSEDKPEPNKGKSETSKGKVGKYEALARKAAEKLNQKASELPSWLINTDSSSKAGADSDTLLKILNESMIAVGKALDTGIELKDAVSKEIKDFLDKIRAAHGVDKLDPKFEQQITDGFSKEAENKFGKEQPDEPKEQGGHNTIGISHEALNDLAQKIGLPEIERGKSYDPKELADRGRKLLKAGADPNKIADDFYSNGQTDENGVSVVRAKIEQLFKTGEQIADKDSTSFKENFDQLSKFMQVEKDMGTFAHRVIKSFQGQRDIDTDSFVYVSMAAQRKLGRELNSDEKAKIDGLTKQVSNLKNKVNEYEERLKNAIDKDLTGESKPEGKYEAKFKEVANKFRKLKQKPFTFIGEDGKPHELVVNGLQWNDIVEIGAKAIEKTGQIADGVAEIIDKIKDSDFYKNLSTNDKEKLKDQLINHYQNVISDSPEAKNIKRLEKKLQDLKDGKLPEVKTKRERSEREKELLDLIKKEKDNLGLNEKKEDSDDISLESLQEMLADKKGDKFTPQEAKAIWDYAKKQYLNEGSDYLQMLSGVANDLGYTMTQVSKAIITPKTQRISDEMWKQRSELYKNRSSVKRWLDNKGGNLAYKGFKTAIDTFREAAVFGHGAIFIGTHAMPTFFDIPRAKYAIKGFFNAYKAAYGKTGNYELMIADLKNSENYLKAQRAGLQNNPERIGSDTEIISHHLKWFTSAGERGFNAIKILRQNLFDSHYNALPETLKQDPEVLKQIAQIINNATGATNAKVPNWMREVTFAGGMEISRWERIIKNPAKAADILAKVAKGNATPAEKVFLRVWATRAGTIAGVYTSALIMNNALNAYLYPDDDKKRINFFNPSKGDWFKLKFGSVVIDPTSGMGTSLRFLTTIASMPFESEKYIKSHNQGDNRKNALAKKVLGYGLGKLSPGYTTIGELVLKHDYTGNTIPFSNDKPFYKSARKLTLAEYGEHKLPLPLAEGFEIYHDAAHEAGADGKIWNAYTKGLFFGGLSGLTGVRSYEDTKAAEPVKKETIVPYYHSPD